MGKTDSRPVSRLAIASALFAAIIIASVFGIPGLALAYDDPDDFELKGAWAFRNLLEFDDFLLIVHYEIQWENGEDQANESCQDTFIFDLLDGDTSGILANTTAHSFVNQGYNEGIVAFYFANNTPEWGSNHTVRACGLPDFFSPVPCEAWELDAGDYDDSTTLPAMRSNLYDRVLDVAKDLERDWEDEANTTIDLRMYTLDREVLSPAGMAYFTAVIPGLDTMAPLLFAVRIVDPALEDRDYTKAKESEFESTFDGTIIGDFLDGWGELFGGVSSMTITAMLTIAGMAGMMAWGSIRWHKATPGLLVSLPILLIATRMGGFALGILALLTFLAVFLLGYFFIFRHASG